MKLKYSHTGTHRTVMPLLDVPDGLPFTWSLEKYVRLENSIYEYNNGNPKIAGGGRNWFISYRAILKKHTAVIYL